MINIGGMWFRTALQDTESE